MLDRIFIVRIGSTYSAGLGGGGVASGSSLGNRVGNSGVLAGVRGVGGSGRGDSGAVDGGLVLGGGLLGLGGVRSLDNNGAVRGDLLFLSI